MLFSALLSLDGWGNARDVDKVWKAALQHRADRVVKESEGRCCGGNEILSRLPVVAPPGAEKLHMINQFGVSGASQIVSCCLCLKSLES